MFEKELAEIARLRVAIAENNRKIRKMLIALVIMTILLIAVWTSAEGRWSIELDDCEKFYQQSVKWVLESTRRSDVGIVSAFALRATAYSKAYQSCLLREKETNQYLIKRREERCK